MGPALQELLCHSSEEAGGTSTSIIAGGIECHEVRRHNEWWAGVGGCFRLSGHRRPSKEVPLEQWLHSVGEAATQSCGGRTFLQWVLPCKGRGPWKPPGIFREQKGGSCGWRGALERAVGDEAAAIHKGRARPCLPLEGVFLLV